MARASRERRAEAVDENADAPGRGCRGGRAGFGRVGPMVKPGQYTVTLGRLAKGQVTALGRQQTVEVAPLER